MASATFEDHPTDPDKVILRKPRHEDDDDIQEYKKPWIGLTDEERQMTINKHEGVAWETAIAIEQTLKEKNV
jgi:hypothetical protein